MFHVERSEGDAADVYASLELQAEGIFAGERDAVANAANLSSLLAFGLTDLNWAGFYFRRGDELVLGPFQGKPACIRIALGRGVCGTAAQRGETIRVSDVHAFPGHIPCDGASRSEIVVPLWHDGHVIGVLDLDSPLLDRFSEIDQAGLQRLAARWVDGSDVEAIR